MWVSGGLNGIQERWRGSIPSLGVGLARVGLPGPLGAMLGRGNSDLTDSSVVSSVKSSDGPSLTSGKGGGKGPCISER